MPKKRGDTGNAKGGSQEDVPPTEEVQDSALDTESFLDDPDFEEGPAPKPRHQKGWREVKRELARQRMRQALQLRMGGATYDQIAETLKYKDRGCAHKAVKTALKDITRDAAVEVRDMELARLDRALLAIWPKVQDGKDMNVFDRFLRLMDQRAKYLGIYTPVKIAPTNPDGTGPYEGKTDSELVAEFESIVNGIRTREAGGPGAGTP